MNGNGMRGFVLNNLWRALIVRYKNISAGGGVSPGKVYHTIGGRVAKRLGLRNTPFLPTSVDLEPIDTCNFACDHCQVTHWERLTTRLTMERFTSILRQLPALRQIKLQGMGEPLLNRHLIDMLEEGEREGIDMSIVSNGSIYTENIASRLSSLRETTITISMDGATAETFESIRVNGNFEKVVNNVADMVRRRGNNIWPRIELRCVATQRNAHELPDLVRLAKRLGVDKLTITTLLTDWGKEEMEGAIAPIDISGESSKTDRLIRESRKVADEIGMRLSVERGQRYSEANRCPWPWTSSYIAANGDVVPCCQIADSSVVKMGNVFDEPFANIWNNDKYRELRRRIAGNDIPNYCRTCYGMKPATASADRKEEIRLER